MRVFREQLEAMQKLKGKTGEQRVTVKHVHVRKGGQAIVGSGDGSRTEPGGRGMPKRTPRTPLGHGAIAEESEPAWRFHEGGAVSRQDPTRDAVPVSGDGRRPLPAPGWIEQGPKTAERIERIRRAVD
jgi:hypothetical protein